MYCSTCGAIVTIDKDKCSECGHSINKKLFDFESERTNEFLEKLDVKKNTKYAVAAYLGPFVILTLLQIKKSNFAKFHANQGLLAAIALILSCLIFLFPNFGGAIGLIAVLISLSLSVLGIMNVIKGTKTELPVIGKIKIIK